MDGLMQFCNDIRMSKGIHGVFSVPGIGREHKVI